MHKEADFRTLAKNLAGTETRVFTSNGDRNHREHRPRFDLMLRSIDRIADHVELIPEPQLGVLFERIDAYVKTATALANRAPYDFEKEFAHDKQRLESDYAAFVQPYSDALALLIDASGLLEIGIDTEDEAWPARIKEFAANTVRQVQAGVSEIGKMAVEDARTAAIGGWAKDAADRFDKQADDHESQSWRWGLGSAALVAVLVVWLLCLLNEGHPDVDKWWKAAYYVSLRVLVVGIVGTVAAFALRACRAHLHMAQFNRHRATLAKSLPSFMLAAYTPAQRDEILLRLVDPIAAFGVSGLLGGDDAVVPTRQVIEQIARSKSGSA